MVKLISMILERVQCVVTNILNSILKYANVFSTVPIFELSETSRDPKIVCGIYVCLKMIKQRPDRNVGTHSLLTFILPKR